MSKWIDKYGGITETEDYTVKDSTQYHRFAYLQWLEDPVFFDKELSDKLVKIKNAKRNGVLNYYLPPLKGKEEVEFRREKVYPGISWKDQGYRLLTLYRLWNAVEYNFPYINYTEHSWATLLDKYLPEFYSPASGNELYLSIQKLLAEINDSHGTYELSVNGSDLRSLPLGLTITADGNYAVESTRLKEIERGAVIKAVNGKSVPDIIEEFRPIIASSNENTLKRDVARRIFQTKEEEEIVTIKVGSRSSKKKLRSGVYNMHEPVGRKGPEDYELDAKNITYINIGEISQEKLKELMSTRLNSKGLILDMRKYPKLYTKDILEKYLYPKPTPYMWFSMNSKTYPGNYFLDIKGNVGPKENANYFKGKIAILVNEGTQSFGELSSIAYRVAPRSAVIGTQTAGANGHIGYLFLPYGIRINYTMSGAFYPDWGMNQRVGVKIDIPVEQTVDNVKYGEDAWIEKAIEYIEGE